MSNDLGLTRKCMNHALRQGGGGWTILKEREKVNEDHEERSLRNMHTMSEQYAANKKSERWFTQNSTEEKERI